MVILSNLCYYDAYNNNIIKVENFHFFKFNISIALDYFRDLVMFN